jgi:signal transduction histidine kinase
MPSKTKYSPVSLLVAIALLLVPVLAYLQYHWIGQLSQQEHDRMQNTLRSTAFAFGMEINREMTELLKSAGTRLAGPETVAIATVRTRVETWKVGAAYPQLLGSCILAPMPAPARGLRIPIEETSSVLLLRDCSGIAIPIQNGGGRCVLVSLDTTYLKTSLLPQLIQSFFVLDGELTYEFAITDSDRRLFFATNASALPGMLENTDFTAPFIFFPEGVPLCSIPTGRMPPPPHFDAQSNVRGKPPEGPPERKRMDRSPGGQRRELALLEMRVKHKKGSLEAAVNAVRYRNLTISVGMLLLLGLSIISLLISAHRARRLARQQLEFVAGVSHELRTPLSVLKSAGENLADGVIHDKDSAQRYGDLIKKEVGRLSDMVEHALTYAGVHSDKRTYDNQSLDIAALIDEALENATKRWSVEGLAVETAIQPDLRTVTGDADALHSVLENLIANAMKYSGESKWVGIEAREVQRTASRHLEITIRDRGIGIPADDLQHIFEPFYRARNAVDGQIQGTGLGLSISKRVVEAHGGTLTVESSTDGGTAFTVILPCDQQPREHKE